jgi:hypothetical protein
MAYSTLQRHNLDILCVLCVLCENLRVLCGKNILPQSSQRASQSTQGMKKEIFVCLADFNEGCLDNFVLLYLTTPQIGQSLRTLPVPPA